MNVLKTKHEMWFLLGTHVNLCFWEMTRRRWEEATSNTHAVVLVAVPRKCTVWPPQALRSSLNKSVLRPFLFETKRGASGRNTGRERILKFQRWVLILELHVGCEIQLLEARLWETLVCRLYSSWFFFFWFFLSLCMSCGTTRERSPRSSVQALWTAEHELWIFGGQGCISDLLFWPSHWEL